MLDVIYTSDADRERLRILQEKLDFAQDAEEQGKILEEIEQIHSRQKPLNQCTLEECTELRTSLYGKFEKLQRIGKHGHAIGFKNMLIAIENRIRTLHIEMSMKEAEKPKKKVDPAEPKAKGKSETSKRKTPARTGSSRWTTGVGNLD